MNNLSEFFIRLALPAAAAVAFTLGAYALKQVADHFAQKAANDAAGSKAALLDGLFARLATAAGTVVMSIGQAEKPALIAASQAGKLTPEDGQKLKAIAIGKVQQFFTPAELEQLAFASAPSASPGTSESLAQLIGTAVEAAVSAQKPAAAS